MLKEYRDSLESEILEIQDGPLKDDIGSLDIHSDPMQTKSFSRGRVVGLIIARDRINKIINDNTDVVTINKKNLKKMISYFNSAVSLCRTFDTYDIDGMDEDLAEMSDWVDNKINPLVK